MLKKWEFIRQPAEKDSSRWRLKLKIAEDDVDKILGELPGNKGRPFLVEDGVFDFGAYFYNLTQNDHAAIAEILKKKSPDGKCGGFNEETEDVFASLAAKIDESARLSPVSQESANRPAPPAAPPSGPRNGHHNGNNVPASQAGADAAVSPQETYSGAFLVEDMPLNPEYIFEQFVVGSNNRFTHAAALAVAKAPGKTYNPFFIHGGVGLGKTHLMQSIGHYVKKNFPDLKVLYVTTEKFVGDVIDAISHGENNALRNFYKTIDVLLVDDIQSLSQSESMQDEFFHIFNLLHQNKKQIVITCDRPPKLLNILEDRLRSRFEWGLIADMKSPTLETRVAILKKKEEAEHLELDDNILLYIASKLKSNIRELEGFLKRITAYSTLTKQEINIALIKTLMAELLPGEENPDITMAAEQAAKSPVPQMPPQTIPSQKIPEHDSPEPERPSMDSLSEADIKIVPKGVQFSPSPAHTIPQPVHQQPSVHAAAHASLDPTLRPVDVVFFFPSGKENELAKIKDKFAEVIKKHKLKFQLVSVFDKPYENKGKINYAMFTELCKTNKVGISVVLAPPPDAGIREEDFVNILGAMMSDEKISLQLVPWNEINKDYRYLNLALDITLSGADGK
jgi:chromosomal replication initiator protein DnaA